MLAGCTLKASLLAVLGETTKELLPMGVQALVPPLPQPVVVVAVNVYVFAAHTSMLPKVAVPVTAAVAPPPLNEPVVGEIPRVTAAVLVVRFPYVSWICTLTAGLIGLPV